MTKLSANAAGRHWKSAVKNFVRKEIVKRTDCRTADTVLLLPGVNCLCLQQAVTCGLVDKRTRVLLVERDKSVIRTIKQTLVDIGLSKYEIEFHETDLYKFKLKDSFGGNKIDFAYLDTCCGPNPNVAQFITEQLVPSLDHAAEVAITLRRRAAATLLARQFKWRSNNVNEQFVEGIPTSYVQAMKNRADELSGGNCTARSDTFLKTQITPTMWACLRWFHDSVQNGCIHKAMHPDVRILNLFGYTSPDQYASGEYVSQRAEPMLVAKVRVAIPKDGIA